MTTIGMAAVPLYLSVEKDEHAAVASYEKETPTAQAAAAAFTRSASTITSAGALMKNYQALTVVLGAYGLSSLVGQNAVVKDLLTQSVSDPKSLAATSGNPVWQKFAKAFADWSKSPLSSSSGVAQIAQDYMTSQFEMSENGVAPGLGNALYFTRAMTGSMTVTDIMGDARLLNVVETVSGFDPSQFGALDYDEQVRLLTGKVDLSDFSSPAKIKRYAEQYLTLLQIHPQATTTPASMLSLYGASGQGDGILGLFGDSGSADTSLFSRLF